MKTILIASDHAGFEMKQQLVQYLHGKGYTIVDMGPNSYDPNDDYTEYISPLAERISEHTDDFVGIVLGGSGQGEAMNCNRYARVRAAVYYGGDLEIVRLSRAHNDANVLSFGARFVDLETAQNAVDLWIGTSFEGGRHTRRIEEIENRQIQSTSDKVDDVLV